MRSLDTRHGFVVFPLKTPIFISCTSEGEKEREGGMECSIGTNGKDGELLRRGTKGKG